MPQWIALSRTQHADHSYLPRQGYTFAVNQAVAPVLLAELPKLLPHYALGFIQQETGYQAVALLSLDGQNNLYLHSDGRWLGKRRQGSHTVPPTALCVHSARNATLTAAVRCVCVLQARRSLLAMNT